MQSVADKAGNRKQQHSERKTGSKILEMVKYGLTSGKICDKIQLLIQIVVKQHLWRLVGLRIGAPLRRQIGQKLLIKLPKRELFALKL